MIAIRNAAYLDGYRLALTFDNGESGVVDLSDIPGKFAAAASLKNVEVFKQFALDEWPTLVWPSGFDLSPEMLYERATGKSVAWLHQSECNSAEHQTHV